MICYLCRAAIEDGAYFYSDHGVDVCKPCFAESPRCFVCRFPGKKLEQVAGLGSECEFCRESLVREGDNLAEIVQPLFTYLAQFGHEAIPDPQFVWSDWNSLREMQSQVNQPPPEFIDDFLRYSYPVYHHDEKFYLLRRMTKATLTVYTIVQFASADIAWNRELPDLAANSPFHTLARGWCHWIGYEAAQRLGYDLERRQMRKWPELGLQGEFERWEKMARFKPRREMVGFFKANLNALARKHLDKRAQSSTTGS